MKRIRGAAGLLFAGALLFAACGQKNGGEEGEGTAFLPEDGVQRLPILTIPRERMQAHCRREVSGMERKRSRT